MLICKTAIREEFAGEEGDRLAVSCDRSRLEAGVSLHLYDGLGSWRDPGSREYIVTLGLDELRRLNEVLQQPVKQVSLRLVSGSDTFAARYDNLGEPYREGVKFLLEEEDYVTACSVFLETRTLADLCKLLAQLVAQPESA